MKRWSPIWGAGLLVLLTAFAYAVFDGEGSLPSSILSYGLTALSCGLLGLFLVYRNRADEHPGWLIPALIGSLTLRLLVGVLLYRGLPVLGYDTQVQNAGYVFADAFARDFDAWELVASGRTLTEILLQRGGNDQYGGLLTLTGIIYKLLSPRVHRPLLIVQLSALFSTIAVYYAWKFARTVFNARTAAITFGVMALYPDAVLLGASQMREPFIMAGMALAFYGYARLRKELGGAALSMFVAGLVLEVVFSPPMAFLSMMVLAGAWLVESRNGIKLPLWVWIVGIGGLVAMLVLTTRAWSSISGSPDANPLQMVWWWLTEGARYQILILEQKSGMVQALFSYTPEWAHAMLATGYGLVQPFFPAAVMDTTSPPIWRVISIWRAGGWILLLPFLFYAPLAAWRGKGWRDLAGYLALAGWLLAAFVSYRAAGDQWDNPRYRTSFLLIYAVVTGWAWTWARTTGSRWLRHTMAVVAGVTVLFLQWYAGRYLHLPSLDLFPTLALVVVFVPGYLAIAWMLERRRKVRG